MRKLTIGMCCYDDYEGVYFTIQSLRLHHSEVMDDVEFIIIDNNPSSKHGKQVKDIAGKIKEPTQYVPFDEYNSTSLRNKIFELSNTPYVMSMDCHVLLRPGALKQLIEYYDSGMDRGNLLQGPLIHDCLTMTSTFFNKTWGAKMQGQWDRHEPLIDFDSEPFSINSQGLGLFSCRKDSWLGFNPEFRGFGGEEQYIHEKYRQHGKDALCLPFLGWVHRFNRVNGVPYPNKWQDRYRNYIIGRMELALPIDDVEKQFEDVINKERRNEIKTEAIDIVTKQEQEAMKSRTPDTQDAIDAAYSQNTMHVSRSIDTMIENVDNIDVSKKVEIDGDALKQLIEMATQSARDKQVDNPNEPITVSLKDELGEEAVRKVIKPKANAKGKCNCNKAKTEPKPRAAKRGTT